LKNIHLSGRMTHRLVVVVATHVCTLYAGVLLLSLSIGTGTTAKTTHMKSEYKTHKIYIHALSSKHADALTRSSRGCLSPQTPQRVRVGVWVSACVCVVSCFGNPVYVLYVLYMCICIITHSVSHTTPLPPPPSPQPLWFIVRSARAVNNCRRGCLYPPL